MVRRRFLKTMAASGALLGLGDLSFLSALPPVSVAEAKLDTKLVRFHTEIEPLVRLLEETPRERLLEEIAARIRGSLSYPEVLAALLLAGVRNVEPHPVGFKFHAVLVVNSAHLASLSSPDTDRWLPIFWALDYFKDSQARNVREGNWRMGPVNESRIPPAYKARQAFIEAMNKWDTAAADVAAGGLIRTAEAEDLFDLFARFGARDFRDIGHKAIFVANGWRALRYIGWQHAEPVLRSLAYGLLYYTGENPARRDAPADRPWKRNLGLATKIRAGWQTGQTDDAATVGLLETLRQGSSADACDKVVELLNRGIAPQSVWDALFAGACELIMNDPSVVTLHAVTCTNALHFAYQTSKNDETRRLLVLQNAAFLPLFRGLASDSKKIVRIDRLEPTQTESVGPKAVAEIFADHSRDRLTAARKTLSYLKEGRSPKELIDAARRLVFLKGDDSHDYKFSSAALEDYGHVSHGWRDRYLAAGTFLLHGSGERDNELVKRTRAALQG